MTEVKDLEIELKVAITTIIQKQPSIAPHTVFNILQNLSGYFQRELQNKERLIEVEEMMKGFEKE